MKSPATVLHVIGTGGNEGKAIAQMVENLAHHIDRSRYRMSVLLLRTDGPRGDKLRRAGVPVELAGWAGGWLQPAGVWRFARAVRRIDPAIVHLHTGGLSARIAANTGKRRRVVVHFHSLEQETGKTTRTARRADLVIANSHATAVSVIGGNALVVHPGVKLMPRRRLPDDSTGPVTIGVAARLATVKGLEYLLSALTLLKPHSREVLVEIAGSGPVEDMLKREVAAAGLSHVVKFLGWRDDIEALMSQWDIYVQPSLAEGFGIAALEAMASGLPVIATDVGGLAEIVVDGETGNLVPVRDAAALAKSIDRLIDNPSIRQQMGERGRERAARHFSLEREAAAIESAYDKLLA